MRARPVATMPTWQAHTLSGARVRKRWLRAHGLAPQIGAAQAGRRKLAPRAGASLEAPKEPP